MKNNKTNLSVKLTKHDVIDIQLLNLSPGTWVFLAILNNFPPAVVKLYTVVKLYSIVYQNDCLRITKLSLSLGGSPDSHGMTSFQK